MRCKYFSRNYKLCFLYTTNLILLFDFISTKCGIFCCILIEVFSKQEKYRLLQWFSYLNCCVNSLKYQKYKEMNYNYIFRFSTLYFEVYILGIWNNHEYGVLMNYIDKCVYNQGRNYECVHIIMQIYCYSKCGIVLQRVNPHLPPSHISICLRCHN
jgi:hypothetical protein